MVELVGKDTSMDEIGEKQKVEIFVCCWSFSTAVDFYARKILRVRCVEVYLWPKKISENVRRMLVLRRVGVSRTENA